MTPSDAPPESPAPQDPPVPWETIAAEESGEEVVAAAGEIATTDIPDLLPVSEAAEPSNGWHGHVPMPVSSPDDHGQEYLPMPPQEEALLVGSEQTEEEEVLPAIELPDEEEFAFDDFDPTEEEEAGTRVGGGGWTIPVLCAGIALIACCVIIPQADANRRLAYERMTLKMEMDSVEKQVAVNDQFLKKVADDPELAERLAQRQMKIIRQGTRVLELKHDDPTKMSPFQLVNVAPPPPLPPYQPVAGTLAALCCDPRSRLYLSGCALIMIAMGLVLGYAPKK